MADHTIAEEWRPVVGWEHLYQVSNLGRVSAIRRAGAKGGIRKLSKDNHGYLQVSLKDYPRVKIAKVHRLVLTAFVGPRPRGKQADHINGDRENARLSNLEWVTPKENNRRMIERHGGRPWARGERNARSRLTEEAVTRLRQAYRSGTINVAGEARRLGVADNTLRFALIGRTWKHLLALRAMEAR